MTAKARGWADFLLCVHLSSGSAVAVHIQWAVLHIFVFLLLFLPVVSAELAEVLSCFFSLVDFICF